MINKNFYRKTNDKKILHKVGKQWKVVSVALLMAVAGGAVAATHANANADNTNIAGATPYAANQAYFNTKPASAKPVAQKSASASVTYYPQASGSAAMYFDKVASDNAVAAKNYNTVNSYVQSLNNEFNPQVNSYSAKSASASSAASYDAKLAASYKVTNNNPKTATEINSLAAQHHMAPQIYQGMVQAQEQNYSGEVKSASGDVKAASDVTSLVNSLEGANLNSASMSASAAKVIASSNVNGAQAVFNSVSALSGDNHQGILTAAQELSYAAEELNAVGNNVNYQANLNSAASYANVNNNANSVAALNNSFSSAVTSMVSSASTRLNNAINGGNGTIINYAADNNILNHLIQTPYDIPAYLNNADATDAANAYTNAVSAATNIDFYGSLASLSTSLYGKYAPQAANYNNESDAFKEMKSSASVALRSAKSAYAIASANNHIISTVDADVNAAMPANNDNQSEAAAVVAREYLNEGVAAFANHIGAFHYATAPATHGPAIKDFDIFVNALEGQYTGNTTEDYLAISLLNANNVVPLSKQGNRNDVANALENDASLIDSVNVDNYMNALRTNHNANIDNYVPNWSHLNDDQKEAFNGIVNNSYVQTLAHDVATGNHETGLNYDFQYVEKALDDLAGEATKITKGVEDDTGLANNEDGHKYLKSTAATDAAQAALLSDGVDLDALNDEANNISHVASAEKSITASSADVKNDKNVNEQFNSALSAAASSANSALGSAQDASASNSAANSDDVTLASYFATSYSNAGNSESAVASSASSALNSFFKDMADDETFNIADDAYADAEANAANDKKMGVNYSKVVYNNASHYLDVLKGAKLHSSFNFGSDGDKVLGSVNKGDRLTVLGVNFNRNGLKHGATRYLVLDNNTKQKGFFTGQPQFSKPAYLNATAANAGVSVKTLKPVTVYDNLNGGKAVKTLKAGTVVNNVNVVRDNPDNDAMGYTKVETAAPEDDFFTANTDYVEVLKNQPTNNQPTNNYAFNLSNVQLAKAYNNDSQY